MTYTAGRTVDSFTLDPSCGEFFLAREAVRMPEITRQLSLNECNEPYWPAWIRPLIDQIKARNDVQTRRVTARHVGSLVADFHRNLVKGGIFLYPVDQRTGQGKLRLIYECAPLALIAEVAGGGASTGVGRLLDVRPGELHERSGFVTGPLEDVKLCERYARRLSSQG